MRQTCTFLGVHVCCKSRLMYIAMYDSLMNLETSRTLDHYVACIILGMLA